MAALKNPVDQKLEKIADKETYRMIKDGAIIDVGGDDNAVFTPEAHSSKWKDIILNPKHTAKPTQLEK